MSRRSAEFAPNGTAQWSYFDSAGIGAAVNFKFTPDGFITITGRAIFGSVNGYAKIDLNGNEVLSYPGVFSLTVGDCDGDALQKTSLVHGELRHERRHRHQEGWAFGCPNMGERVWIGGSRVEREATTGRW